MEHTIDIEGEADRLHFLHGSDPARPMGVGWLAAQMFGAHAIDYTPHSNLGVKGMLVLREEEGGEFAQIRVSASLPLEEVNITVSHELGEYVLSKARYFGADREAVADALGRALIAPSRALRRALRKFGTNLPALARAFILPPEHMARRYAEATRTPTVIASRSGLEYLGAPFGWPTDQGVRALVSMTNPPGFTRHVIGPRTLVLIANP